MITKNKGLLRFLIIFFGLQAFPFPLDRIPFLEKPNLWLEKISEKVVLFISNHVLQIPTEAPIVTGSGDKHYNYVFLLVIFILAILGTTVWTFISKNNSKSYKKLNYWFWVYLRFYLAATLILYGLVKFFPLQMPAPSFARLITPYGDFSPMGVAWTFIGTSTGYQVFSGAAELIAGLLLLHRRTTLLGGIIACGVLCNVVALNFFYDVPVKIFSTLLLLIAIIIISPQAGKLFQLFFGNSTIEPYKFYEPVRNTKRALWINAGKWLAIGLYLIWSVNENYKRLYSDYGPFSVKPPLYGLYEVQEFQVNGENRPPLLTDTLRWRYIASEYPGRMTIYDMERNAVWMKSKVDTLENALHLSSYRDTTDVYTFKYQDTDSTLTIQGLYKGDTIKLSTKRFDKTDFPLMQRKFNWVQEYPYNR